MSIPIIFFHRGYQPYLAFSLWQASQTNPQSPIILLGDAHNTISIPRLTHYQYSRFAQGRDEFVPIYKHFSFHEVVYERTCIERWFYLRDFLQQKDIEQFFFLDSDVILLSDLNQLQYLWDACSVAGAPYLYIVCYCSSRAIIERFCSYVLSQYRDAKTLSCWASEFAKGKGVVNDMTLIHEFALASGLAVTDLRKPHSGVVFDNSFCGLESFGHSGARRPIGRDPAGNFYQLSPPLPAQRLANIHAYGHCKRYVSAFTGWNPTLVRWFFKPNYRRNLKKLLQYYYFGLRFRKAVFVPLSVNSIR